MPSSFSIELEAQPGATKIERPGKDTPFRIAVLGDFSGRENRRICDTRLSTRKAVRIDRDNFDQVLSRMAPTLCLPVAGNIGFSELEDFHPDRLYERLPLFQALRETRGRLDNPATFAAAAAELLPKSVEPAPAAPASSRPFSLDELIDSTESQARPIDDFRKLVNDIVGPHLVPKAHPKQAELVGQVDSAVAAQMRAVLRHPEFQALESAWESLFFLIRKLDTGVNLQVFVIDISKTELAADLLPADDLKTTQIYRLLVEQTVGTPGAHPWAVLASNYTFGASLDDADLLARLSMLGRAAGAPFLAGAAPELIGCKSLAETPDPEDWKPDSKGAAYFANVRRLPEACWAGLAAPRFLLRLPYGEHTEAIESFAFEEMDESEHGVYLWGNPAIFCACLIGMAFSEEGWRLRPGVIREIGDLPAHSYHEDGEHRLKPCAEILMTERASNKLLDTGIMPLASLKGTDVVRLVRFQSIADPAEPLAGRWD